MHCVCVVACTQTDMCLAQTCCNNKTQKGYCKSSCICWQCYCRHVSCCWPLSSSRKSFTCNGDSLISHFVDELFSGRWVSVDRSMSEVTIASKWSAEWCAGAAQCGVLCAASWVLSLFWILSRIGQSDVVRYGANCYRDFQNTIFVESCRNL